MLKLALLFSLAALAAFGQVVDLTILHFNDFHAKLLPTAGRGGAAHLVSAIEKERANCPRCVVLNAGDNVQGSPVSTIYRGLPVFEVLRPARVDAFALGNHEFDYGADRINDFIAAAGHPVLAANFVTPEGRLFTEAGSVVLERDGLRIGIVGVLMEDLVPKLTTPAKLGNNRLLPALDVLRAEAARLRGQTDILIALVHLWKEQCDQIVAEIPEYAVVVSGHDHGGMMKPFRFADRLGVRLRANGSELGRLDLRYDKAERKIVSSDWKILPVGPATYPAHPETAAIVEKWERKVKAVVDVPIGTSKRELKRDEVRAWIETIMRDTTKSDFVFMNSGGVRDTLPAGALEARNLWNIMPFDNLLVTAKVKGALIPPFIRKEQEVDPEKLYSVSTIDFLIESWRNGADPALRAFAQQMPLEGPLLRDAMLDWVRARKTVE
ncbi:MAG: bifunctional UDP-sugar hydrolase/5'-nucleotidase [Bryobacter sp.]|nr:bifunctional UDP-sugar hydrolase/5'-nucleotidase [Bryobacter sp.]